MRDLQFTSKHFKVTLLQVGEKIQQKRLFFFLTIVKLEYFYPASAASCTAPERISKGFEGWLPQKSRRSRESRSISSVSASDAAQTSSGEKHREWLKYSGTACALDSFEKEKCEFE